MMKKLCMGIFALTVAISADGFDPLDESLIAGKDFPFPPGEEADATADDSSSSDSQDDDSSQSQDDDSGDSQDNGKEEKDVFPES